VTWGELTAKLRDEKPAETPKRRASALPALALLNRGNSSDHVQVAVHGGDAPRNSVRASVRTPEPLSDEQICQFDRRTNRLIDFRLPDVNGREVRFQDLDADLILLDFWGTWCPPCLESIPHLVKLQETHGPKRLKIVGIAYEQTPIEKRAASVMATAGRLGINYTLLLGRTEAPCPVRDALHVQVYPTMVLLDRHGRVLWRQEGATAQTLARLNRMVGIALQDSTRGQTTHR
jgi:thiol-disulfide isomerase/thioredoxin